MKDQLKELFDYLKPNFTRDKLSQFIVRAYRHILLARFDSGEIVRFPVSKYGNNPVFRPKSFRKQTKLQRFGSCISGALILCLYGVMLGLLGITYAEINALNFLKIFVGFVFLFIAYFALVMQGWFRWMISHFND